jgi:hypothetical protein
MAGAFITLLLPAPLKHATKISFSNKLAKKRQNRFLDKSVLPRKSYWNKKWMNL